MEVEKKKTTLNNKSMIIAIDSGSTGIRAMAIDSEASIIDRVYEKTPAKNPEPGAVEHDPIMLWNACKSVLKKIFENGKIKPQQVKAIGITNQRASFCLWEKKTGKPLSNFIGWADVRAANTADRMNKNKKWKILKKIAALASKITNNPMMTTTALLNFTTDHASVRLRWFFDEHPDLLEKAKNGEIQFGTLDTWFVYNLTNKKVHATDVSNAAATGMYNPFQLAWNDVICNMFKIPMNIFGEVKDSNGNFGKLDKSICGEEIPIRSVIADQSAALFGQRCFQPGDVKISQGSGAFVDCTIGNKPKVSKRGLFPLIAWGLNGKVTYMLEGYVATAGTLIDWLGQGIGLSETPKVLNEFAAQCNDTEGVLFVPTPSGIRFPFFNPRARGSILGLSLSTHRRHVARAVLEGIALRLYDILDGIEKDTKVKIKSIKVDGGVSKSDILLQSLADFADIEVKRAPEPDMTAFGAAFLAGLGAGLWKSSDDLLKLHIEYKEFRPMMDREKRREKIEKWQKAIKAILQIY